MKNIKIKIIEFWNDDSLKSWLIFLFIILPLTFLFIKFIFFPLINLISGCDKTLVVIESGSMHHDNLIGNLFYMQYAFDNYWEKAKNWYLQNNITKEKFKEFPFRTGMEIGDIIVLTKRGKIKVGDVIVFEANQKRPIIHRVISIKEENGKIIYSTKGDANPSQLPFEEKIEEEQIVGKAIIKIPLIGYPRVFAAKIIGE
ncbi:MAG: signal peptidase I [Candidatus Pacearchaeota archaeon]